MTTLNEHTLVIGENLGVNKQKYNKVKYIIIERSVEAHEVLLLSYYICFFLYNKNMMTEGHFVFIPV